LLIDNSLLNLKQNQYFMAKKTHKSENIEPGILKEPAVAYQSRKSENVVDWNPNAPVHATQEEWWEHFHRIEEGQFMTWEEHKKKFDAWKKEFLANRMM
jgi:hypothetical protein